MAKITGKTKSGYAFEYDERKLNDWRLTSSFAHVQDGTDQEKTAAMVHAIEFLIGKENMPQLLEHVAKQNDGFIPNEAIVEIFIEIISQNKDAKN